MTAADNYRDLSDDLNGRPAGNGDQAAPEVDIRAEPGGDWILDAPPGIPAVWGHDTDEVLWSEGEPLMIAGPTGVGKTTVAGQLMAARVGLIDRVLGFPVKPGAKRTLYLAMDRPRQIRRAFGRLVRPEHRDLLNDRLRVRSGPPARDLARHPEMLAYMANAADADTVFIDSLKDAALGLKDDEVGAGVNRAFQIAVSEGTELAVNHHQRKGRDGGKPKTLEDVYGSTWIVAGLGSILLLWGQAGDALVELSHLKQPGAIVGPLKVEHDHDTGRSAVYEGFDLLRYLRNQPGGVTADQAAQALHEKDPTENQIRAMRRQLDKLVGKALAHKQDGTSGGAGGGEKARWHSIDTHRK